MFTLFTVNYSRFQPGMGVPVRSSQGFPRFPLRYELTHSAPETFPPRSLLRADPPREEFRVHYFDSLARYGVERIARTFQTIADTAGDDRLVLLCFEDLAKGKWCHRTLFAEWWTEQTGDPVRELGPKAPPALF